MQALNDWAPPWPPPDRPAEPLALPRWRVRAGIFKRAMKLSILGGMGMGVLCMLKYGIYAWTAVLFGGIVGMPLGVIAGIVLSVVGGWLLVPYRGPVVALTVISGMSSCLVMSYLSLLIAGAAGIGSAEGPQSSSGPSWDWLLILSSMAAAVLSPWLAWWYVKRMESNRA